MQQNISYNTVTTAMQALASQTYDSHAHSEVETSTHLIGTLPSHVQQDMQLTQDKNGGISVKGTTTTSDHLYAVLEEECTPPHGNGTTTTGDHLYAVLEEKCTSPRDTSTTCTTVPSSMDLDQHNITHD